MKHSLVTLPEFSSLYPHIWISNCEKWRIIRDVDNIQFILMSWQEPKWRPRSYHVEYGSLLRRWSDKIPDLPDTLD